MVTSRPHLRSIVARTLAGACVSLVLLGQPAGAQDCGTDYGIPCEPPTVPSTTAPGGTDGQTDGGATTGGATTGGTTTGGTTTGGVTTSGGSSGLPITGSDVTTLAGVGIGAIAIGFLLRQRGRLGRSA